MRRRRRRRRRNKVKNERDEMNLGTRRHTQWPIIRREEVLSRSILRFLPNQYGFLLSLLLLLLRLILLEDPGAPVVFVCGENS